MKTGLIARAKLLDRRANGPAENQPVLFVTHFHDNRRNCLRLVARVHDAAGKCEIFVARGKLPSFGLAWHVEQQIGLGIIRNKADVHGPAWRTEIIKRAAQNADGESEQHCRHGPHFRRITAWPKRSEEHTSELQSLMRNSYAVFCLQKKTQQNS